MTAVAIVGGTGKLGYGLARALARAGVDVVVGSRDEQRARASAERLTSEAPSARVGGAANADAVEGVGVVVLAAPFASHAETVLGIAPAMRPGQLVIDTTVPLAVAVGGKATRVLGVWQGSAAQQTAELVPDGVAVVAALHTVSAAPLGDGEGPEQDVLLCGDHKRDKLRAADLLERIPGLRCVDCGRLEQARITEQITSLLVGVSIRYKTHAGIRIIGVSRPLSEAPSAVAAAG